jgi:hypothetical protein
MQLTVWAYTAAHVHTSTEGCKWPANTLLVSYKATKTKPTCTHSLKGGWTKGQSLLHHTCSADWSHLFVTT